MTSTVQYPIILANDPQGTEQLGLFPGGQIAKEVRCGYGAKIVVSYEVTPSPLALTLLKYYGFRRRPNQQVFAIEYRYAAVYWASMITGAEYTQQHSRLIVESFKGSAWADPCFQGIAERQEAKLLRKAG